MTDRLSRRRGVVLVPLVAIAAVAATWLPARSLMMAGCTSEDIELSHSLSAEPVLGQAPSGATAEDSYVECDDDDRVASAGARYKWTGRRGTVLEHYQRLAQQQHWQLLHEADPATLSEIDPVSLCFVRSVAGQPAYMSLVFEGDWNSSLSDDYFLDIQSAPDLRSC